MGGLGVLHKRQHNGLCRQKTPTHDSSGIHLFWTPSPSADVMRRGCEKGTVMLSNVSMEGRAVKMGSRRTSLSYALLLVPPPPLKYALGWPDAGL